ncbi:hypothetical protein ACFLZS_00185 [Patescibacteria group bacterium]
MPKIPKIQYKPIMITMIILGGLELLLFFESVWHGVLGGLAFIVLIGALWILNFDLRSKISRVSYIYFLIPNLLLLISGVIFAAFLQGFIFQQILVLIITTAFYILFRTFTAFLRKGFRFAPISRNNLSLVTFFTAFLAYAVVYGSSIYFNWPGYLLIILVAFVSFLIFNQSFWQHDIFKSKRWVYILGLSFLMAEVALVMSYAPINYLAGGLVFLVIYYVLWGLTQHYFEGVLTKRLVLEHVIIAFVALTLALTTARWLPIAT